MPKSTKKPDINQIFLKAHKLGVKNAIDVAARSNTLLVVYENGKVRQIRPNYKYVRVPIGASKKKLSSVSRSSRHKK